jgi:hypothetical protein
MLHDEDTILYLWIFGVTLIFTAAIYINGRLWFDY